MKFSRVGLLVFAVLFTALCFVPLGNSGQAEAGWLQNRSRATVRTRSVVAPVRTFFQRVRENRASRLKALASRSAARMGAQCSMYNSSSSNSAPMCSSADGSCKY